MSRGDDPERRRGGRSSELANHGGGVGGKSCEPCKFSGPGGRSRMKEQQAIAATSASRRCGGFIPTIGSPSITYLGDHCIGAGSV